MAKRNRRSRRRGKTKSQSSTTEEQFQLEYGYVLKDLRRVFILAAIMFILLIALNLLLQSL